ncbi:MAG: hypothetical protein EOP34_03670 [Rickettsiales bacterium]|nr:MAG: hypothetical protein EOP34_03670 [Rickettsiales bacterium]
MITQYTQFAHDLNVNDVLHYNPTVDSGIAIGGQTREALLLTLHELIQHRAGFMPSPEIMDVLTYVSQLTLGPRLPLDPLDWSEGLVAHHVVNL